MKTENDSRIITNEEIEDKSRIGYVRVSSVDQNEARQLEAFKGLNLYKIFIEKISAKDTNRPLLQQMLEYVRCGDTVYIKDFSRLARSTKDLLDMVEDLNKRAVKLISLKENLDTSTPTGKLMLTMIGAINAFERENLLERQREGIAIAKQKGKFKGRKAVQKPDNWDEVYHLYMTRKITGNEAIERTGLKRNTFYKFVNEAKEIDDTAQ
jgi:DNA invertase Pin-like site-specific DNA recombinase